MRTPFLLALCALLAGLAGPLQAQAPVAAEPAATAAPTLTDGEVRRVDREAGKLTIKHGPISNLDMPPMTMVFVAREAATLANLKPGDKIRFQASKEGGSYLASGIEPAP